MSRHVSMTRSSPFLPQNDLFRLGLSSNYFKMNFNNSLFTFDIFFFSKIPFFGPSNTRRPENQKNLTVSEFDENFLGN